MKTRYYAVAAAIVVAASSHAQTLTIAPPQAYVLECQETFVTISGTNLTGTTSTLVDFSGNGQLYELEPSTATPTSLVVWIPLGVAYAAGDYAVTVKANDTGGTRTIGPVTFSVVVRPANAPPVLSLPEVVVAVTTSSSGAVVTFDGGGASCDHPSGSLFPVGTTTVTCSASNGFGTTSGTFSVVVTNTAGAPPAFTLPEVIIAEAASPAGAVVSFNTSGATCDHASGATYPLGNTTVTCSATNSFGTTTVSMTVAVLDTTPPVLNLPSSITSASQVVTYTATANDAVDGSIAPVCTPASGSTFQDGTTTTVVCTASDAHGNSATGSFTVTVHTPQLADFTASQDVYQLNAAGGGTVTYTSNVPLALTETLTIRSDATGQTVRTLWSGVRAAGTYQDAWNGRDDAGQLVPDGAYRYFATVSANGGSFTWDDGARAMGSSNNSQPYPLCRNDAGALELCYLSTATFDPYANKPLRITYCTGAGDPPACSGTLPYVVTVKTASGNETSDACDSDSCILREYQASGAHEVLWWGRTTTGVFNGSAPMLTVIRRNDTWPRNLTLVYGTAPSVQVSIPSPTFTPGSPTGGQIVLTVGTFQSRQVTVTAELRNTENMSLLRTITLSGQPAGQIVINWDGRADNGALVIPAVYEATITVRDSAGSTTVLKPLITARY